MKRSKMCMLHTGCVREEFASLQQSYVVEMRTLHVHTLYIWKDYLNYTVSTMWLQIIRLYYSANCKVCPNIYRSICIPYLCMYIKEIVFMPIFSELNFKLKLKIHFLYYSTSNGEFFQEIYLVGPTTLSEFKICYISNGLLLSKKFPTAKNVF